MASYPKNTFFLIYQNINYQWKLLRMIKKFMNDCTKTEIDTVVSMIFNNMTDEDISGKIIDIVKKYQHDTDIMNSKSRAKRISNVVYNAYRESKIIYYPTTYLDIGCNTGAITVEIAKKFKIDNKNTYGIDVEDFSGKKINPVSDFNFKYYDGKIIPFADNTFDVITCAMVIHHIPDINFTLQEIYRVLCNDGLLILKEHSVASKYMDYVIYIEHLLYSVLYDGNTYTEFVAEYYQKTYSINDLKDLMSKFGLVSKYISGKKFNEKYHGDNFNNTYYSICKKNITMHQLCGLSDIPNIRPVLEPGHDSDTHPIDKSCDGNSWNELPSGPTEVERNYNSWNELPSGPTEVERNTNNNWSCPRVPCERDNNSSNELPLGPSEVESESSSWNESSSDPTEPDCSSWNDLPSDPTEPNTRNMHTVNCFEYKYEKYVTKLLCIN